MGLAMTTPKPDLEDLIARARGGDQTALATLFAAHRGRLRQMVALRLDRRLQG
jgi:RNA polymerase sigma-70 factor (ECF subfamily)